MTDIIGVLYFQQNLPLGLIEGRGWEMALFYDNGRDVPQILQISPQKNYPGQLSYFQALAEVIKEQWNGDTSVNVNDGSPFGLMVGQVRRMDTDPTAAFAARADIA